ncbi:MAG: glycoside hydrolase family 43 protein [Bacteroidales bacterium]|nr:glycoside hydrolase family 43 protein [Bacteroidales bacterium]
MTSKTFFTVLLGTSLLVSCGPNPKMDLASRFDGITPVEGYKAQSEHNPIYQQRFGADPYAMVYNDRVYIYMTDDIYEYDENGNIKNNSYQGIHKINCVSSADLVNWTDHGAMNVAGADGVCKYARCSWAPTACHKNIDGKEQFFLYFADGGNGMAVAVSDTPYGPWTDPRGNGIITRATPTCNEVPWLFDPAVLVDDDGTGYIYFGGGVPMPAQRPALGKDGKPSKAAMEKFQKEMAKNSADPGSARVCKLAPNMIELEGEPARIRPPYLFEDAGANKINGKYYYSYCTNFSCPTDEPGNGRIAYMVADDPMGPYEFKKVVFDNPGAFFGTGGNNHHSIFEFKGQYYLAYHAQKLQDRMGVKGGYRSTHIDAVTISENGEIQTITGTLEGVPQLCALDPYEQVEAETMAWMGGIDTEYKEGYSNMVIKNNAKNGAWVGVSGVDFGDKGASGFCFGGGAVSDHATIKIVLDSLDGECVGYVDLVQDGSYGPEFAKPITGKHDVFFIFEGDIYGDWWTFIKAE